jgi:Zn finger protein HypA/HybF involved in hydrogenase expression
MIEEVFICKHCLAEWNAEFPPDMRWYECPECGKMTERFLNKRDRYLLKQARMILLLKRLLEGF